jgi:hypothetical protein
MRGKILYETNERVSPGMNGRIVGYYRVHDIVEIIDTVRGDYYDGNDYWYRLTNGNYIWSGEVEVRWNANILHSEDQDQFLISYRKNLRDSNVPNVDTNEAPDKLYFSRVTMPADPESIRVSEMQPDAFANLVTTAVNNLNNPPRKHVIIYIHGYQIMSSFKFELWERFLLSYLTHDQNNIAKVIFFSWPSQGSPNRKTVDDRSLRSGRNFTEKGLFSYFEALSDELKSSGKSLSLVVHSFGHQLLNGMLNPDPLHAGKIPHKKIFENVFLMAPDITHLVLKNGGEMMENYFRDDSSITHRYKLEKLCDLSEQVHVFHDKWDYLLYISTRRFVGNDNIGKPTVTENYRNLGNYGQSKIPDPVLHPDLKYWNVENLVSNQNDPNSAIFPFDDIDIHSRHNVDMVWNNSDFKNIQGLDAFWNQRRFQNRHRYLFTCKQVVDKVIEILK